MGRIEEQVRYIHTTEGVLNWLLLGRAELSGQRRIDMLDDPANYPARLAEAEAARSQRD